MYKTISSRLTARFKADGSHFDRYISQRSVITKSLCEDLILNNQIFIPTTDYLTAIGLLFILGEPSFIQLLETQKIKFIRTRNAFGYARGAERDGGLVSFSDPENKRPQDCSIENSVDAALSVIPIHLKQKSELQKLLVENSFFEETADILEKIRSESIKDFKQTSFWRPQYEFSNPDLLNLPGSAKMSVHLAGAEPSPKTAAIDAFLSLASYNADIYLAQKYNCQAISPFCPIGDLAELKFRRLDNASKGLWELFEVTGIPDLSHTDFTQPDVFKTFEKTLNSRKADDFRSWFHSLQTFDRNEITKEYISVLHQTPWTSRLPVKIFRFVTTTAIGMIPGAGLVAGTVASAFDSFVLDRFFNKVSPKFFIDDLNKVSGTLNRSKF